jgi:hypothetical protein
MLRKSAIRSRRSLIQDKARRDFSVGLAALLLAAFIAGIASLAYELGDVLGRAWCRSRSAHLGYEQQNAVHRRHCCGRPIAD